MYIKCYITFWAIKHCVNKSTLIFSYSLIKKNKNINKIEIKWEKPLQRIAKSYAQTRGDGLVYKFNCACNFIH